MERHAREKYVSNTEESRAKLVEHIINSTDNDGLINLARVGLTNHYIDCDQHFIDDYYHTFGDEDPDLVDAEEDSVVYVHGNHSNICIIGEIHIPKKSEVIMITHNIIDEEYGDSFDDITKLWDAQIDIEKAGDRFSSFPDSCICIPFNVGEHTHLANQVLKQILINNKVENVIFGCSNSFIKPEEFFVSYLGIK